MERIPIPLFYGTLTLLALGLAWLSHKPTLVKTGMLMLLAWVCCNVAVEFRGASHAPLIIPSIDAFIAICIGGLALANRDLAAGWVFALFVAIGAIHVLAFSTHTQGTYLYYLALNLVYLAQIAVVGGAGGRAFVASRAHLRGGGAHARPVGG